MDGTSWPIELIRTRKTYVSNQPKAATPEVGSAKAAVVGGRAPSALSCEHEV